MSLKNHKNKLVANFSETDIVHKNNELNAVVEILPTLLENSNSGKYFNYLTLQKYNSFTHYCIT